MGTINFLKLGYATLVLRAPHLKTFVGSGHRPDHITDLLEAYGEAIMFRNTIPPGTAEAIEYSFVCSGIEDDFCRYFDHHPKSSWGR